MKAIKVSQRLQDQIPAFIKDEDQSFVDLLVQYYKSQEKSGKPYDILNNILGYTDISSDEYDPNFISSESVVLTKVSPTANNIVAENVDYFLHKDGTIKIDDEIIFYESVTQSPEIVFTPGVNYAEFKKKIQELESIVSYIDGSRSEFDLKLLSVPVSPSSSEYIRVIINGIQYEPYVHYVVEGSKIRFFTPPTIPSGASQPSRIEYLIGYTSVPVRILDTIEVSVADSGKTIFPLTLNTSEYIALSTVSCLVAINGVEQLPFKDYTIFGSKIIFKQPLVLEDILTIRAVELIAPQFGKNAAAVSKIENGKLVDIVVKDGGSDYRINFTPKVTVLSPAGVEGSYGTAEALVNGIKELKIINGGQGYTSLNPPVVVFDEPEDPSGIVAKAYVTVDDASGQVSDITVVSSGSGYETIPSVSFRNPAGAKITNSQIDENGSIVAGSITVVESGADYTTPPTVYIDRPDNPQAIAASAESVIVDGRVTAINIISPGRGYTSAPRCRIIDPIGAQILDVQVSGGKLVNIELLTGGRGYTDPPSVYIVDNRKDLLGNPIGGEGATAVATIFNGEITDINITSFGDGYSTQEPPTVYIASPLAAAAACTTGFGEITGFTVHSQGENYLPSQFINCKRAVSATSSFDIYGNQVHTPESESIQSSHNVGAKIENLDSLFAKELYQRFVSQFLPNAPIDYTRVNAPQIIKTIKDFYVSKGTKTATEYLFKVLFSEDIEVAYPKDELIKPSAATWSVNTIIRVQLIAGSPKDLSDGVLFQYADAVDTNIKNASCLIENTIAINTGDQTIYELSISEETLEGKFAIPYKTTLVEPISTTDSIITVDSTIGWPERNGTIILGETEYVQYKEKSLNQFIECTRSTNGIVDDWDAGTGIQSDIFCYVNKGTNREVKLRILGIAEATGTVLTDTGSYYLPGDKLSVASLGSSSTDNKINSWLYNVKKLIKVLQIDPGGLNNQTATVYTENNHGLLVGDSVTIYGANPTVFNGTFLVTSRISKNVFSYEIPASAENPPQGNILMSVDLNKGKSDVESINGSIKDFTTNVQNTFFNNDYAYVATTGIPNYKVGPFIGSALVPGNQRKLVRFPRKVETISRREEIVSGPIGAWVNGVAVWSYKSQNTIQYGGITDIVINNPGKGYDAANIPNIEIAGGGGTGASARVTVNGSLYEIEVTNGGSGFTSSPLVSIVGGGGFGATATAVITNGTVSKILVETPGQEYTSQPTISISGGGGSGATAIASVRGPIKNISITNTGENYTSSPKIVLNSGTGAVAQPIIINGRIVSIAIIASGSGYTTPPRVVINGSGYGAVAKAVIGTFGEDKGKVLGVTVENRGIGYTSGTTTIRLEAIGELADFTAKVFKWTRNLENELTGLLDKSRGYVFAGYNTQYGGEYAHLSDPKQLRYVLGDNVFLEQQTGNLKELTTGLRHSPIIGWAYDGNPIYGPYGYIDATNQASGIKRMVSSYRVKPNLLFDSATNPNPERFDGPPLSEYPAESFIDDYEYVFQRGDLDQYNGRFCKTPEYPNGIYAYFTAIDASERGLPIFPYICGPQLYSTPDKWNYSQNAIQTNIPADVVRFRDPYQDVDIDIDRQPNQSTDSLTTEFGEDLIFEIEDTNKDGIITEDEIIDPVSILEEPVLQLFDYYPKVSLRSQVDIEIETTTKFEDAQISGFVVENPGISYKVNDKLYFDNEGTGGYGVSAKVSAVKGIDVVAYTSVVEDDIPYGIITTDGEHDLREGDEIIVNSIPIIDQTNKTFRVKVVSGLETVTVEQEGLGYSEDIPPTYEVISSTGKDFQLDIVREESGAVKKVNIINSGSGYDKNNPPEIRVSHPQRFKKASYALAFLKEQTSITTINDIAIAEDRTFYVVGQTSEEEGDTAGVIAKFNSDGRLLWTRTMLPLQPATGAKSCVFNRIYVQNTSPHSILVFGEVRPHLINLTQNPDLVVAKFESGFDGFNNPTAVIKWQREIAGISGFTRRDYASSITIDQDGQIYIGGWTDTNSPSPDDMWICLLDVDGTVKEKRKICSASSNERMTDLRFIGSNRVLFAGIDDPSGVGNIVVGETFYDTATVEVEWSRKFGNAAYRFSDVKVTIDDYDSLYVVATATTISTGKTAGIAYLKFAKNNYNTPTVTKLIAPNSAFEEIRSVGLKYDIFGNIDVSAYVRYAYNNNQSVMFKISWNTNEIITSSALKQVDGVGFQVKGITNDTSGDTIIAGDKVETNQLAILNFETSSTDDGTYNRNLVAAWTAAESISTSEYKYGSQSVELTSANSLNLNWQSDVSSQWTIESWIKMRNSQYTAQASNLVLATVVPTTGNNVSVEVDGVSGSANYGKVVLKLGSNTYYSTTNNNWDKFNNQNWVHFALVKEAPGVGTYIYKVYINGVEEIAVTSTQVDTQLKQAYLFGEASPTASTSLSGWVDNISVSGFAKYLENFSATEAVGSNKIVGSFVFKLDKDQTKLGTYTLNNVETGLVIEVANAEANYGFNTLPVTSANWTLGAAGLQILDYGDVVANNVEGSYSFTSTDQVYATKTATIPTPLGKKLLLSTSVIPKFYMRDALYISIDNIKILYFNQPATFTKGATLQQYQTIGGQDVVSAYGVITDVGFNYVSLGKIIGNFDQTKKVKSTANDVNDISFIFNEADTTPEWKENFSYTTGDVVYNAGKLYTATSTGISGPLEPLHAAGTVTDGNINWAFTSIHGTFQVDTVNSLYGTGTLADFASWKEFSPEDYVFKIDSVYPSSIFIKGDTIDAEAIGVTLTVDNTGKIATFTGLVGVKSFTLTAKLSKDIVPNADPISTDLVYCQASKPHQFETSEIIFVEGFTSQEYNGSFFVKEVFSKREFTFRLRAIASQNPTFLNQSVGSVNIYAKHPKLLFVRGHQYIFDLDDTSNLGYFVSFSKDNQYKLEYPFINVAREGIPGLTDQTSPKPLVKFIVNDNVTNISYYFDPSRTADSVSPVSKTSFIDVIETPYKGKFQITQVTGQSTFKFRLASEPENSSAPIGVTETGLPRASYSTTSTKAIGPIADIKLVNPGGFYQKLPIVSDIASNREIEKIRILSGGTEYVNGVYYNVPINGDGEGASCNITVADDGELLGTITKVELTSAGKGYTFASVDIDSIPGILGPLLAGSGGDLEIVIPNEGSGASVFLQGRSIGKIKKLKNNEFGFGYSHDYTLKPEITFPVNLQLFNTAILAQIKVTNPGSGYTSTPRVVIEGGGGIGAEAEAIVKNNRLSDIIIKNPGSGYSSEPIVTLKSEFNYVVNIDLGYLQFNFPHGITTGAEIQLRAEDLGSTVGVLPKPSSAGLVSLNENQIYYAIAGIENSLEADQLRIALTKVDAESGNFITFLTQGEGRQIILTEVFGGQAEAIVETSRFLKGELVYQGSSLEAATATGYVSTNEGWQIGPRILKLENYEGTWVEGERVTGQISRAAGTIDNLSIARGTLNIDSLTTSTGQFIDDVGKPSEIVQKIQDSYFYQNFSYVIKSKTPINQWRTSILETNHPVGFNMFGELSLTGGKDISGRKVISDLVKEVNISNFTNTNQITSFANTQPIYTQFNNTEVLFRQKRLTNSEEILTSIVKKLDDISADFDGIRTQFPLNVEGDAITATDDQMLILLNGIAQSPSVAFTTSGPSIVFSEPPRAPSRIKFRNIKFQQIPITRFTFSETSGIFPTAGKIVRSLQTEGTALVIDSAVDSIDVVNVSGSFSINDNILSSATGFDGVLASVQQLVSKTIFEQGESIYNLNGKFAILEGINLTDGNVTDNVVASRTSGTAKYETGEFEIRFNDIIYSTRSKIAAKVLIVSPYFDASSSQIIDTVDLSPASSFFGLVFQRVPSITYPNEVLDDISQTVINPTELYSEIANNQDFLDFEEVRNQEIRYQVLAGGQFQPGDKIRNKKIYFNNSSMRTVFDTRSYDAASLLRKNSRFIAEEAVGIMKDYYPSFTVPSVNGDRDCEDDIVDIINVIAYQLEYDGNSEVWDAAATYVQGNSIYHVNGEVPQAVYAMEQARDLMIKIIRNEVHTPLWTNIQQYRDTTIFQEFGIVGDRFSDARKLILDNKWFIAHEALYYAKQQNPSLVVPGGDVNCLSDIVDVLETMVYNLAHGGNDFMYYATERYLKGAHVAGYEDDTVNAFTKARDLAIDVMRNIAITKQDNSHGWVQVVDNTITVDPDSPACQDVASAITSLFSMLITSIGTTASPGTLAAFEAAYTSTVPPTPRAGYTDSCISQTSAITNFIRIITDTLEDPTGADPTTYQWSIFNLTRVEPPYAFEDGETIRCTKHAYLNKSSGGFFSFGNVVKGITSGATFDIIGSNAGNKWIYSKDVTGTLQVNEYITNSLLTISNVSKDDLTYRTNTGSLYFTGTSSRLVMPADNRTAFGAGDYTIEAWIRPSGVSGVQRIIDLRTTSSDTAVSLFMSGTSLRLGVGASDVIIATSAITTANTWYHVAVTRTSGTSKMFVNGSQVGSDYTDSNTYADRGFKIGASYTNGETFTGHIDSLVIRSGVASYSGTFTPPTIYDDTVNDTFVILGDEPFPIEKGAIYANYVATTVSEATADEVELWRQELTVEVVDLGREEFRKCATTIRNNIDWIAEEAVGRLKDRYPDFVMPGDGGGSSYGTNICLRDTKTYIIPAIIQDLIDGGNYNTTVVARAYLESSGALKHIAGELLQSTYTWNEVGKLCIDVITLDETDLTGTHTDAIRVPNYFTNPAAQQIQDKITELTELLLNIISPSGNRFYDAADLIYFNRKFIADEAVYYIEQKYEVTVGFAVQDKLQIPGGRAKCVRDLRDFILPAIVGDLMTGGNNQVNAVLDSYIDGQTNINFVENELLAMLDAIDYAKYLCGKAIGNLLISKNENPANVALDFTNYYQAIWSDLDVYRDNTITVDTQAYQFDNRIFDAANQIERNARSIAEEAVDLMTKLSAFESENFKVPGGKVNCEDDIVAILDQIVHDLRFGGNSKTYDAAFMYLNEDFGLQHIENQSEETLYTFKLARDMTILTMQNRLGFIPYEDATASELGVPIPRDDYYANASDDTYYDAANEIENNLAFIASTAVGRTYENYPSLVIPNGPSECIDDIKDVLQEMIFNLKHGGNNRVWYATEFYITNANAIQHVTSQAAETKYAYEQARDIAIQVLRHETVTANVYTQGTAVYDTTITVDTANPKCQAASAAVSTLMGIVIGLFTNTGNPQGYLNGVARTLPEEWPLTGDRAIQRDITITYDTNGCQGQVSAINTLWNIVIDTVDTAASGGGNYLAGVTRTEPVQTNTLYNEGVCYDVRSAMHTLFGIITDTLGSAPQMYRDAARILLYNDQYIRNEAYYKTTGQYTAYSISDTLSDEIVKALQYDLITNGNAATLNLINSWFDAEGNFIAFQNEFRTRVVYHVNAIKQMVIDALQQDSPNPGTFINESAYRNREIRISNTAIQKVNYLFHLIMTGLERSSYPTVYLTKTFDAGVAVSNSRINVTSHRLQAYDKVEYVVLGTSIPGLDKKFYWVHPLTTGTAIYLMEYPDADPTIKGVVQISAGNPSEIHTLQIPTDPGIERVSVSYGIRNVQTPINGGISLSDVVYGTTTGAYAEIVRIQDNLADILYVVTHFNMENFSFDGSLGTKFVNGEQVVVQGATQNTGYLLGTDNATYIKLMTPSGVFAQGDTLEGLDSGATGDVVSTDNRILVNFRQGEFLSTDKIYSVNAGTRANALVVRNNNGALLDNQSGRITFDIETITGEFKPSDVIYGSVTDQIVKIEAFTTLPAFGEYIHAREITRLTYSQLIVDTGITDTFEVGDVIQILNGGVIIDWTITVTELDEDNNYLYVCNITNTPAGVSISDIASNSAYTIGKIPTGSLFPSVYTQIAAVNITQTSAYGKIAKIVQSGASATLWLEDSSGSFQKNAQLIGNASFRGACSAARYLRGRVRRYFRGFDGVQTTFKLTTGNGNPYFPDPAGHMMIFVNAILQPPGADYSFTSFSDVIQFTEAPAVGSTFHGVYVGKLRQLDDISFDFDSLRNSFNLKLNGVFYSLTLTDGVQSNTIRPENNIICQLNGVIQEPGIGFELVGSRIIFSEIPRAGSTFVAFSYIGSDIDVIAATVVPPIEIGDELIIDGEEDNRTVALIESSNSLITFEYSGAVKGRGADALAEIEKGRVISAVLTNSGDGYNDRPQVDVISSSGFGARIKALVGIARVDVKNAGQGYRYPTVLVENTVPDDYLAPTGPALNSGLDIYDPGFVPVNPTSGIIETKILVLQQPRSITVNQGQIAVFAVRVKLVIDEPVVYRTTVATKSALHPYFQQGSTKGFRILGGQFVKEAESPILNFIRGATYVFNQVDATNIDDAIYFSTVLDATAGESAYTNGVVYKLDGVAVANLAEYVAGFNTSTQRTVEITTNDSTPATLFYASYGGQILGSSININAGAIAYQWQRKDYGTSLWENIPGATGATYTSPATTQAYDRDEYRVGIATLGAVPVLSEVAELTINIGATVVSNFNPIQVFDDP